MKLAAYNPCSLIDDPGCIAAVVFAQGCNMACPYCHNAGLLEEALLDPEVVLARLAARRGQLDSVVVSGGEPTLQPDLPDWLARIKAMGFRVKLDTNGTRPAVLKQLVEKGLVDHIAMDIKTVPEDYERLTGVAYGQVSESIAIVSAFKSFEFRTTVDPSIDPDWLEALCRAYSAGPYWLQQYRPSRQEDPEPYPDSLLADVAGRHGVKLRGVAVPTIFT